jgi:hypothetical protein
LWNWTGGPTRLYISKNEVSFSSRDMTITASFTFVRSNKNRGGGDDDFDVRDGDRVIGRIVRHPQAPKEAPWFWAITAEGHKESLVDRGYAASREDAVLRFKAQWLRDDLVCRRVADLPTPHIPSFIVRCVHCNAQIWVGLNSPSDATRICSHCARQPSNPR